jgi:hypothetical protein
MTGLWLFCGLVAALFIGAVVWALWRRRTEG